jgi:hypothetical protein
LSWLNSFDIVEDLNSSMQPRCPWRQIYTLYLIINVKWKYFILSFTKDNVEIKFQTHKQWTGEPTTSYRWSGRSSRLPDDLPIILEEFTKYTPI